MVRIEAQKLFGITTDPQADAKRPPPGGFVQTGFEEVGRISNGKSASRQEIKH